MALPPTAQSCLPFLGVPPVPPAAHVHPQAREGARTAAHPHLAPAAAPAAGLGSGISPLAVLHSAPGPRLQECHSRRHKGPLCEQGRGVGAQPSISSWGWGQAQLRARGWAAADSSMAPQLPARHGGLPTAARGIREESPLLILLVPPAPAASCSHCWLRKQHPHQYRASAPVPRDANFSATPQGEQEGWDLGLGAPASSCWIRPFQQLPSQCQQQGMCLGWGFPRPGHSALNKLFIVLVSLLSRNGLCSSCTGLGAWVPPLSPPPAPSGIPARKVRFPKTKYSWLSKPSSSSPAASESPKQNLQQVSYIRWRCPSSHDPC